MSTKKFRSGGFVFAEFAIALPLLILLLYGLAQVGLKIFELGRDQLADYVLEEEAQYVMERIIGQARTAEDIKITNSAQIVYHSVEDSDAYLTVDDVRELQYYMTHEKTDTELKNIYAKRNDDDSRLNPITGDNSFGLTKVVQLKFSELNDKVLHVTLEMESVVTGRRIKLNTAVYMPACKTPPTGLPHEQ